MQALNCLSRDHGKSTKIPFLKDGLPISSDKVVRNNTPTSSKISVRYIDDFEDSKEENTVIEYLIIFITSNSKE